MQEDSVQRLLKNWHTNVQTRQRCPGLTDSGEPGMHFHRVDRCVWADRSSALFRELCIGSAGSVCCAGNDLKYILLSFLVIFDKSTFWAVSSGAIQPGGGSFPAAAQAQ
jgi:hypothetical protein